MKKGMINMMNHFKEISPEQLRKNTFQMLGKDWMLITAGNQDKINTMTASWGGLGIMYGKEVAYVVIRPQRYTREFVDQEETFSLSFLGKEYRKTLNYLGSVSGRDEDKIAKSDLTVGWIDDTPYFEESNFIMVCKKLLRQPLNIDCLLEEKLKQTWYRNNDTHILYIAEITKLLRVKGN